MANALFDTGRAGFLSAEIDWDTATIKAALVRGYTFNASHSTIADVTGAGGALVATSDALTNKTITAGVADADDTVWASVAAGAAIPAIIVFQASVVTGGADVAPASQRLIAFLDDGTGLPVTPNGQNITSTWSGGADRIFRL